MHRPVGETIQCFGSNITGYETWLFVCGPENSNKVPNGSCLIRHDQKSFINQNQNVVDKLFLYPRDYSL